MKRLIFLLLLGPFLAISQTIPVEEVEPEEDFEIESIEQIIYTPCKSDPEFPGGESGMMQFILDNLEVPKVELPDPSKSIVYASFIVSETGVLKEIKIIRGISEPFDQEVLRVISLMPRWIPAEEAGKPVAVGFTIPVRFCFR